MQINYTGQVKLEWKKTIADINHRRYDDVKIEKRYKEVSAVNWITVFTILLGIGSIVIFISVNILN